MLLVNVVSQTVRPKMLPSTTAGPTRQPDLVAERGGDTSLERRGRSMPHDPRRERGVGASSRVRGPRCGPDDRPQFGTRSTDRTQQSPPLADDLSDRSCADRHELAAQVLGERRGRTSRPAPGVPVNLARRSSRCVAIPVGQVSRWHWRAMSQPIATSAAVPNANSSAPSSAATSRSRPVCRPPSVRSATRSRRPFRSRTWWTSARPSSHGAPTCLIEDSGDAPVPPACPDRWM